MRNESSGVCTAICCVGESDFESAESTLGIPRPAGTDVNAKGIAKDLDYLWTINDHDANFSALDGVSLSYAFSGASSGNATYTVKASLRDSHTGEVAEKQTQSTYLLDGALLFITRGTIVGSLKTSFPTGFEGGNYACNLAAHNGGSSIIPNPSDFEWKAMLGTKADTLIQRFASVGLTRNVNGQQINNPGRGLLDSLELPEPMVVAFDEGGRPVGASEEVWTGPFSEFDILQQIDVDCQAWDSHVGGSGIITSPGYPGNWLQTTGNSVGNCLTQRHLYCLGLPK